MLNLAKLANRTWVPKLVTSEVYRISATLLARGKLQSGGTAAYLRKGKLTGIW